MLPNTFSFSHYTMLLQCMRKYQYTVLDKIPEPQNEYFAFGTALHAALNTALESEASEAEKSAVAVFNAYWLTEQEALPELTERRRDELSALGPLFIDKFMKRHYPKIKPVQLETRLKQTIFGTNWEGTPDAIVEYDGVLTLIDFKTSAYNYDKDSVRRSMQLHLYALLAQGAGFDIKQLMYMPFIKSTGGMQNVIVEPYRESTALDFMRDADAYLAGLKHTAINNSRMVDGKLCLPRNVGACIIGKSRCSHFERCHKKDVEEKEANTDSME